MKQRSVFIYLQIFLAVFIFAGNLYAQSNVITQISTINALMTGVYDGSVTISQLKKYGNFGLGTFNSLDGEMIALEGRFYKIKSDGKVEVPGNMQRVPFAAVTDFKPGKTLHIDKTSDMQACEKMIDSIIPTPNIFYALRIDGTFKLLRARSVPKQQRPYQPLIEVVKKQSEFKFQDVEGTLVAFRCPSYVKGVNVPGYHFHFISKDRKSGGHVLDFIIKQADVRLENISGFKMLLPSDEDFYKAGLSSDREQELKKVEK